LQGIQGVQGVAGDDANVQFVQHGADANVARPVGFDQVVWYGSVQPVNAVVPDIVVRTDESEVAVGGGGLGALGEAPTSAVWYGPDGTLYGTWGGTTTFGTNTVNSALRESHVIFDVGVEGLTLTDVSIHCAVANDGVGAAVNFAVYEINDPLLRTKIADAGSAAIGTTGLKTVSGLSIVVPRYFAIVMQLTSLNTAGVNPTFGYWNGAPPRVSAGDPIANGNNGPNFNLGRGWASGASPVFPTTLTPTSLTGPIFGVGVKVQP
jgi:hypothetical protein